ncbi:DUF305 domain-containing protein [Microbacterium sp.]|uniref:DUF305 domain-containing protein n=1 Tax=Microbacterium sp. TaxID=51671 RepID=UPI003C78E8E2
MTPTPPRPIDKKPRGNPATQAQIAPTAKLRGAMGMASDAELVALDAASGRQADCLFLRRTIRHHESAITKARSSRHDPEGAGDPRRRIRAARSPGGRDDPRRSDRRDRRDAGNAAAAHLHGLTSSPAPRVRIATVNG